MRVTTSLNGTEHVVDDVWEGESLLYLLRERVGLPGAKNACEQGECGSCTVYLDGTPVCSCLVAAGQANGRQVTTVEGLGSAGHPGPVQRAFLEEQAAQCGYCIAGMIMRAQALLASNPSPDEATIRQHMAINLCRCGTHMRILRAVRRAARDMKGGTPGGHA